MADTKDGKSGGAKSTGPSRDKSDSPSRDKRGGGKSGGSGLPERKDRSGTRRHHDRKLTPSEAADRAQQRADARKASVATQKQDRADRQPKGWAGRRAARRGR
jgi:hypothetical protein